MEFSHFLKDKKPNPASIQPTNADKPVVAMKDPKETPSIAPMHHEATPRKPERRDTTSKIVNDENEKVRSKTHRKTITDNPNPPLTKSSSADKATKVIIFYIYNFYLIIFRL